MSIFIHRCPECGHADHEHTEQRHKGNSCSFGYCGCSRVLGQVRSEPSVLIPTWLSETGEPVTEISAPGARMNANPNAGLKFTCGCDSCQEAYAEAVQP